MEFYQDKESIIKWLDKNRVQNYNLLPDDKYGFKVDVEENVILYSKGLTHIPVKFNHINGSFWCNDNKLINLEFCPSTVNIDFSCNDNILIDLEFCPSIVGRDFWCHNNPELKEIQYIRNFNKIYKIHRETLVSKFHDELNQDIDVKNESRRKVKI